MRRSSSFTASLAAILAWASTAGAANDVWDAGSGFWSTNTNWADDTAPGNNDTATFNLAGARTVSFLSAPPSIQALTVSAGNVTFDSFTGVHTLSVNSASGTQDVTVNGGSTFTVGASGKPLNLSAGDDVIVNGAGTFNVSFGSQVSATDLQIAETGGNGTVVADGLGTLLTAIDTSVTLGDNGGTATLTYRNAAQGSLAIANSMSVAHSANAATTATLNIESSAGAEVGNLNIGTGSAAATGTVNVHGSGSTLSVLGSSTMTIGSGLAAGIGALNIGVATSGGIVNSGAGLTRINPRGTVTVGNGANTGTLNVNGDFLIDGGVLQMSPGSSLGLLAGKSMTIQNGGDATANSGFGNQFITATNAVYNITGAGSRLDTTGTSAGVRLNNGAQMNVTSGGAVSSAGDFRVGTSGAGTLVVDGLFSSVAALGTASASEWGASGATASVTFRNIASGSFRSVLLSNSTTVGTTAAVSIESGADVTITGAFSMAAAGGGDTSATLTITGAGSSLTVNPPSTATIGHSTSGTAVLNVDNGGQLTVNSPLTLRATAQININGGTMAVESLTHEGGVINLNAGSLSYLGNLTVGPGGLLGTDLNLHGGRHLNLSGTTTVAPGRALTLAGGTLSTGTLVVNGTFNLVAGTLSITQAGAVINTPIVTSNPSTININANNVTLGSAASFSGFNHQGVFNVGANTVTLNSAAYARLGVLTAINGGAINAPNGVAFGTGASLLGHGAVNARVAAELGSVIEADGALALGDAASPAGFVSAGEMRTRQHAVTINSSAQAALGNLTTLGSGVNPGTLNAANGVIIDFGHAITGHGTINSSNTLTGRTVVNGVAQGNSATQELTFTGYVKGAGTFNNVNFAGTFDPGLSPTLMTVGNIALAPTSTLVMELGGASRGSQYDAILASGNLDLGGTLRVALINGFAPSLGASFDLLDWDSLSGNFSAIQLPPLASGLTWRTSQLAVNGQLSVVRSADFQEDHDVDGGDFENWKTGFGTPAAAAHGQGDADGDQDVDGADFLTWQSQFGAPAAVPVAATVPEPGALILLFPVTLAIATRPRAAYAID
jgi:hypothetical protein